MKLFEGGAEIKLSKESVKGLMERALNDLMHTTIGDSRFIISKMELHNGKDFAATIFVQPIGEDRVDMAGKKRKGS